MFTGIIQAVGHVAAFNQSASDVRLYVHTGPLDLDDVQLGDSIAVNGVCLTAVELPGDGFKADVSAETLAHTTLGQLDVGGVVNLEKALTLSTRLGGHLVSGHVDGLGVIQDKRTVGRSIQLTVQAPQALARYISRKGSICVDGISLTVNALRDENSACLFELNIVPHTLQETTLAAAQVGQSVNLEVDLVARYLERLLGVDNENKPAPSITEAFLAKHGFL